MSYNSGAGGASGPVIAIDISIVKINIFASLRSEIIFLIWTLFV